MSSFRILVPSGCLGNPCPPADLARGVALAPDAIAVDAGSTDSGPYYLGAATSKMTRAAIKHDLRQLMLARGALKVPLLIGSCGTSGTDAGVDWTAEICAEIAAEAGLSARVALLYSEQDKDALEARRAAGQVSPLPPMGPLDAEALAACDHVVALMGYEPFAAAVAEGADIVLAGRATDTAVLAALAIAAGKPPAAAWHAAKIAECGGQCAIGAGEGGVMISLDDEGFEVEPLSEAGRCTPYSVSAHLLYENADPWSLKEPGVIIDASQATYRSLDERRVRVTGSQAQPVPYTLKLEGSGHAGFRTMSFTGIADPEVLADPGPWLARLERSLRSRIASRLGYGEDDYQMDLRPYGWNALDPTAGSVSGPPAPAPREIGLMVLVSADSQAKAHEIAKFCNPALLHFPVSREGPMPSWAFPYSPPEVDLGPYYAFRLNHVVQVDDPLALIRRRMIEVGARG
jgi:hypothetical protein